MTKTRNEATEVILKIKIAGLPISNPAIFIENE
jgi:hypothetical protein